jgi:hypothetical protein
MKAIHPQPKLVEQVHEAILTEISEGLLRSLSRNRSPRTWASRASRCNRHSCC